MKLKLRFTGTTIVLQDRHQLFDAWSIKTTTFQLKRQCAYAIYHCKGNNCLFLLINKKNYDQNDKFLNVN